VLRLLRGRTAERGVVHVDLRDGYGISPYAHRAAHEPAITRGRVPKCVLFAWARPRSNGTP